MEKDGFLFSYIKEEDIPEVYLINTLSLRSPWSMEAFNGEFKNNFAHYIVCKYEDNVIAFAGMWIIGDESHITNVAVHPNFRHMRIGTSLIKNLKKICREHKVTGITLEVRESNIIAQNLYKKEDFINAGVRKNFYTNPVENGIIMWCHKI